MARIDTIIFDKGSICNGKPIEGLTPEEKKELVNRWAEKGTTCIIKGFNDKNLHCSHEV